jgi:uncharacterized membrane protein
MSRARTLKRRPPVRGRRERGSLAVMAVLWLLVAVTVLGVIDIGNVFFVRRDLQRVADMAALAAAQKMDDQCIQPTATAQQNATANNFSSTGTLQVVCGRWDIQNNAPPSYFSVGGTQLNAVQVTATLNVPYFFLGPTRTVQAMSTARATNTDQFTIGTTLASLQNGAVNQLLNALLGTNLNLSVASYQALVGSTIKISDLMVAAGVGTVNQLLALPVTAGQFMQLMLNALTRTQVVNANLQTALGALQTIVNAQIPGGNLINVGSTNGGSGVIALGLANTQAAVDAQVNVFDAIMVAAEVAAAGKPAVQLATGLQLAGLGTTVQVQIIQPPVLAVGEAGMNPSTGQWRTLARTAQVRLYLNVNIGTQQLSSSLLGAVGVLLNQILTVNIQLPLSLEAAPGTAWLQSTDCATTAAASNAVIGAQPGLANLCIGNAPSNMSASQPFSCNQPATVAYAGVLGAPILQLNANVALPAVVPAANAATLTFNGITGDSDDYQTTDSNAVGSVLGNALSGVSQSLSSSNGLTLYLLGLPLPIGSALGPVLSSLSGALNPIFSSLDALVVPLLNLLGAQVGSATVHNEALTCGTSQTIY